MSPKLQTPKHLTAPTLQSLKLRDLQLPWFRTSSTSSEPKITGPRLKTQALQRPKLRGLHVPSFGTPADHPELQIPMSPKLQMTMHLKAPALHSIKLRDLHLP